MDTLYLIDGMSLVFRAYHAMSRSQLKSASGELTFAVFGFSNIMTSLLEKENPECIAVVFDTAEPTFRHIKYPDYKANRDEFPEDLVPQLARIKELLDLMSIRRIEAPGFEADDIIGTLSKNASDAGREVRCITSDKDFYQLVNERVKLYKPSRKGDGFDVVGLPEVKEKFGGTPLQVIDVLALMGDSSDNVPGVKGVGEKSAIPLVQQYGSVEGIYEHIDEIDKKALKTKLVTDKDKAFLSKDLVTIKLDVPLSESIDDCKWDEPKYAELDEFFRDLGFNTLRRKWAEKANYSFVKTGETFEDENKPDTIENVEKTYKLIDTEAALNEIIPGLEQAELLSVDLETSSLDKNKCEIVGIALSYKEFSGYYVAVHGPIPEEKNSDIQSTDNSADAQGSLFDFPGDKPDTTKKFEHKKGFLPVEMVIEKLKPILESVNIPKCGQNIKFDSYILKRYGINVAAIVFDSMLASYILNPDMQHNLDALSLKWLNYEPVSIKTLIGEKKSTQKSMKDLEPKQISDYACEDADLALRLRNKLYPELESEKLTDLAEKIEFPLIEVLVDMESNGVAIDEAALKELSEKITKETGELTTQIYDEAGTDFNIDSPKQLGHILFEKLMIPPVKKTKTGYSTDVQVLTQLAETFPIAKMVLEYRSLVKLQSTYIDALPKLVNPYTGRIHTTFNQTVASTGRLSSTDPNLQNIPIRTVLGKEVRKAFIPQKKDGIIFAADYSQVELRIMASICKDEHLINAFKNKQDIHAATASILYDKTLEDVNSDMRRVAKTVNFGIMYGLGAFGLSQRLGIGRAEAKEIIDNYFEKYPGIRSYIDMTIESARHKGYAETLCGRRRYFPDIQSNNRNLRTAAERAAINMPIQGTASDMMKIAMIAINKELHHRNMRSLMMIQVHDELVFETCPEELELLKSITVDKMQSALSLGDVPVTVDTGKGDNWFEAH